MSLAVCQFGCRGGGRAQFEARQRQRLTANLAATQASPAPTGLTPPAPVEAVVAVCPPPAGWKADPLETDDRHTQQVWVSPSGKTAYGVIHFSLPLPVGAEFVHWNFLREMKKEEGEAIDLGKVHDPALPGLRFVAEGGEYKLRANLIVQGFEGWTVYAGTKRQYPVDPAELELAERAREQTVVGVGK